jgi:hypothetical protein
MSGIVFFGTTARERMVQFYTNVVGADVWLEQPSCTICKHGNLLFGFCDSDDADTEGVLTFFYDSKGDVDEMYEIVKDRAHDAPVVNEEFDIYQFFADDPDGRTMEFQTFLHDLPDH